MESNLYYLLGGIAVLTFSLFRHQIKRRQREAAQTAQRKKAAQTAAEAEKQRQIQAGQQLPPASRTKRMPEPAQETFAGRVPPQQLLKWELEIDQIGRRMLGQLDSKMTALQTLLLESNRTANRIEILLEALEKYKRTERPETKSEKTAARFMLDELTDVVPLQTPKAEPDTPLPVAVLKPLEKEEEPETVRNRTSSTYDVVFRDKNRSYRPMLPTLELRKQIEMLADYGYESSQIAQNLNIPIGEVDVVLSTRS